MIKSMQELISYINNYGGIVNDSVQLPCSVGQSLPEGLIEITGDLYIYNDFRLNSSENQLKSLGNLRKIGQTLFLSDCPYLEDLGALEEIGFSCVISSCPQLSSLGMLNSVTESDCEIKWCEGLEDLGNLKFVGNTLKISGTPRLKSLNKLTKVGHLILNCPNLEDLGTLEEITKNKYNLELKCPKLTSLGKLRLISSSWSIIQIFARYLPNLEDLGCLERVEPSLTLSGLEKLKDLGSLKEVPDTLIIEDCPELFSKSDLNMVKAIKIEFKNNKKTHNEYGPALIFDNKNVEYWLCGQKVTETTVMNPDSLTPKDVFNETSNEIKKVMLTRYGINRFLNETRANLIDTTEYGKLWQIYIHEQPIGFIEIKPNSKNFNETYWLFVPPVPNYFAHLYTDKPVRPDNNLKEALSWLYNWCGQHDIGPLLPLGLDL